LTGEAFHAEDAFNNKRLNVSDCFSRRHFKARIDLTDASEEEHTTNLFRYYDDFRSMDSLFDDFM
jgi:hypothetical protein